MLAVPARPSDDASASETSRAATATALRWRVFIRPPRNGASSYVRARIIRSRKHMLFAATAAVIALVGGQVIDGYEGTPIHDGVVLLRGERIAAVGRRGEVEVPKDAQVIDTRGMSVLPGLMDMHVHLMILGHASYEHWDKTYIS